MSHQLHKEILRLGTRASLLALRQANWVKARVEEQNPGVEVTLVHIKTQGDKIDVPLFNVGGKGLFVKEIEEALLGGDVDLAVHSAKDLPILIPEGLALIAFPEREDPRDALISKDGRRCPLVLRLEGAIALVQHLQHADAPAQLVEHGHAEHAVGVVAGVAVDLGIEARVGVGVGDVDDAPPVKHSPAMPALAGKRISSPSMPPATRENSSSRAAS